MALSRPPGCIKRLQIYRDTHAGYLLDVLERMGWLVDASHSDA
jgi:hypothetical protein